MAAAKIFLRAGFPFNYNTNEAGDESGLKCEDKSLALQSQAEDADINVILRRFGVTGQMPASARTLTFQDFDGIFDFRTALEAVKAGEEAFMRLPAEVRGRFQNDPQSFVVFCSDPANLPELRKMGLAKEVPSGSPGEAVAPASAPAPSGG